MNKAPVIRSFVFLVVMSFSVSLWAGCPLPADAVPAHLPVSQTSSVSPSLDISGQAEGKEKDKGQMAAAFIFGMTLLILLPVGVELVAPQSVGRAFTYRRAFMQRRVLP